MLKRVVSGGQTGVDRAALDVAQALGITAGGWCPRGRVAEDGIVPPRYPLRETPLADYAQRTDWNVRDSDGTLVLVLGAPRGGTALTIVRAETRGKPLRVVDLSQAADPAGVAAWINHAGIAVLNVAGPRESQAPGIAATAARFLRPVLARAAGLDAG